MKVWIFMGSNSDIETMSPAEDLLKDESIPHEVFIHSAHREPD
ncbi:AIR carboxylase family protein, partial [candidate division WOR-3 bacterium]|nr:AIR carboxylase family protein [candidate division WOR-3 bacterium]